MVDVDFAEQLVDSMSVALEKLEAAISAGNKEEAIKLKTFIFDLYSQLDKEAGRKNV
jgi:hypothetical protein